MPADLSLSREDIEQIVRKYRDGGQISSTDAVRLFQHVLSEPDRIEAAARIAALEAENAALREVLRSLAEAEECLSSRTPDGQTIYVTVGDPEVYAPQESGFTVGDLRRARALLCRHPLRAGQQGAPTSG